MKAKGGNGRPTLGGAGQLLKEAHHLYQAGQPGRARPLLEKALGMLERLRPGPERDALLAQTHLGLHVLTELGGQRGRSEHHLRLGISYARTAPDAETRAQAQTLWARWQAGRGERP